jgi:LuxR family maltose regulon positive regulatory protein
VAAFLAGDADTADRTLADAAEVAIHVGGLNAAAAALAVRALLAIRLDRWEAADALLDDAAAVIDTGRLHAYPGVALNHALRARASIHRGDVRAARAELAAADLLLPALTRALACLAVPARLELARAAIGLGDLPAAQAYLTDAQGLLRNGLHFPVLADDADQLAAALDQQRATAAGRSRLTPAELRLLPLLATQHPLPEIADQLFVSIHTVKAQVKTVYRKLGVSSRTQAIERGRSLGLLPAPLTPAHRPSDR